MIDKYGRQFASMAAGAKGKRLVQEQDDINDLLTRLGLDPEQCRTDAYWLNVPRTLTLLREKLAAHPEERKPPREPMQPVMLDEHGVARFKANKIVLWLLSSGRFNLNELACMGFPAEDEMQLAQLIGYSVSGYGDLSYVTDESYERASEAAHQLHDASTGKS